MAVGLPPPGKNSARIALDGLLVAQLRILGILPELPPRPALAQKIPPLVEPDLDLAQLLPLGIRGAALRFALEQLMLPACQLVDPVGDPLVIHGASPRCASVSLARSCLRPAPNRKFPQYFV